MKLISSLAHDTAQWYPHVIEPRPTDQTYIGHKHKVHPREINMATGLVFGKMVKTTGEFSGSMWVCRGWVCVSCCNENGVETVDTGSNSCVSGPGGLLAFTENAKAAPPEARRTEVKDVKATRLGRRKWGGSGLVGWNCWLVDDSLFSNSICCFLVLLVWAGLISMAPWFSRL